MFNYIMYRWQFKWIYYFSWVTKCIQAPFNSFVRNVNRWFRSSRHWYTMDFISKTFKMYTTKNGNLSKIFFFILNYWMSPNNGRKKLRYNPLIQYQFILCILIHIIKISHNSDPHPSCHLVVSNLLSQFFFQK